MSKIHSTAVIDKNCTIGKNVTIGAYSVIEGNVKIDDDGALELSKRSRGTPRIANRILRRTRDYAEVKSDGKINKKSKKLFLCKS